jgi:hypothetical protein
MGTGVGEGWGVCSHSVGAAQFSCSVWFLGTVHKCMLVLNADDPQQLQALVQQVGLRGQRADVGVGWGHGNSSAEGYVLQKA